MKYRRIIAALTSPALTNSVSRRPALYDEHILSIALSSRPSRKNEHLRTTRSPFPVKFASVCSTRHHENECHDLGSVCLLMMMCRLQYHLRGSDSLGMNISSRPILEMFKLGALHSASHFLLRSTHQFEIPTLSDAACNDCAQRNTYHAELPSPLHWQHLKAPATKDLCTYYSRQSINYPSVGRWRGESNRVD